MVKSFYLDALLSVYGDGWQRSRGFDTSVGRRARGQRLRSRRASRSRREAGRAAGGGRWSGSVLRGRAGERTGVAPAGAAGDGAARVVNLCDV